jgi:hypothetical protein
MGIFSLIQQNSTKSDQFGYNFFKKEQKEGAFFRPIPSNLEILGKEKELLTESLILKNDGD